MELSSLALAHLHMFKEPYTGAASIRDFAIVLYMLLKTMSS